MCLAIPFRPFTHCLVLRSLFSIINRYLLPSLLYRYGSSPIFVSHLMLFPATAMYRHLGVSTVEVSLICPSLTMIKLATCATSKACQPARLTPLCTDAAEGVTAGQRDPTLPFLLNDLQERATLPTYSFVYRWRARLRAMLQMDETWVGGGAVNCQTCALGKGKEMSIRSQSNFRRVFEVVIGQGLLRGGRIKRDSRNWVSSALWSGAAFQYRPTGRRGGGWEKYATAGLRVICLPFPSPYGLLLVQWKVNGSHLRPNSTAPSSYG